jgi:hypothetical protein
MLIKVAKSVMKVLTRRARLVVSEANIYLYELRLGVLGISRKLVVAISTGLEKELAITLRKGKTIISARAAKRT